MTARLPPYSTYRTDKTQVMVPQAVSQGNILTFTPRGFKQTLNVKFPDSRLAVCEKCKKNYKTRDSCRVRSNHTSVPWTTAYICITVDDSCTDSAGNYVDKPLTARMSNWQPYCVKELFDENTPVCAACKKTNRTKTFCRLRHKHRQMPWCTVFVVLSSVDSTDPSTVVAAPSVPVEFTTSYSPGVVDSHGKVEDGYEHCKTDDINAIEESRTFLAKISTSESSIHWLVNNDSEEGINSVATESDVKALNDAIRTPGAGGQPAVADTNQQYYQMTQQAMQQQAYVQQQQQQQQPFTWPYPTSMIPMGAPPNSTPFPPAPPPGSETQMKETGEGLGGISFHGSGSKESAKHNVKSYKLEGSDNMAPAFQQVNGENTSDAFQQHQAWQAQMRYQNQIYQNQMYQNQVYAAQQQQFLAEQQKPNSNGESLNPQDIEAGDMKQAYLLQDGGGSYPLPNMSGNLIDPQNRESFSLTQENINATHPQTTDDFNEADAPDIQVGMNEITEPGIKIEDGDLSHSISPYIFNHSFTSSDAPKRDREESQQVSREVFGEENESDKRARLGELHDTSD